MVKKHSRQRQKCILFLHHIRKILCKTKHPVQANIPSSIYLQGRGAQETYSTQTNFNDKISDNMKKRVTYFSGNIRTYSEKMA